MDSGQLILGTLNRQYWTVDLHNGQETVDSGHLTLDSRKQGVTSGQFINDSGQCKRGGYSEQCIVDS